MGGVILGLRALGVGDLATAVPALRGLRRTFPDQPLWLVAPAWLAPLVALTGAVDRLLPLDGVAGLPAGPLWWPHSAPVPTPALAVNLHGRGPQSHRLLATAGAARTWAFACPAAGWLNGPQWTEDAHEVDRWCRLLHWYGAEADPADLELPEPEAPRAPAGLTVVHPGAKAAARRWPPQRYAAVARALAAAGHQVVVTGSAVERPLAVQVATAAGLPASAVLAGATPLLQLAALVARARLVICGDTGVAHLATGFGTPSVLLFGPMPPQRWGPPPERAQHRVLWHGPTGLPSITADEVLQAAADLRAPDAAPADPETLWRWRGSR